MLNSCRTIKASFPPLKSSSKRTHILTEDIGRDSTDKLTYSDFVGDILEKNKSDFDSYSGWMNA
jgi:hypothetical protein